MTEAGFEIRFGVGIINEGRNTVEFQVGAGYRSADGIERATSLVINENSSNLYPGRRVVLSPGGRIHFLGDVVLPSSLEGDSADLFMILGTCPDVGLSQSSCELLESENIKRVKLETVTFKPDLVVTEAVQLVNGGISLDGVTRLRHRVTVTNQGNSPTRSPFAVATEYTDIIGREQQVDFEVRGYNDTRRPQYYDTLMPQSSVTFDGYLIFPFGSAIPTHFKTIVDDCRSDGGKLTSKKPAGYCQVDELDETNNSLETRATIPRIDRPLDIDLSIPGLTDITLGQ